MKDADRFRRAVARSAMALAGLSLAGLSLAGLSLAACAPEPAMPKRVLTAEQAAAFAALKDATDPALADRIAEQALSALVRSNSATVNVLMDRAAIAEAHGNPTLARRLLDEAIALEPGFAEAYGRRAGIAFSQNDFASALADLQAAAAREPRHFSALAGLGAVYEALNRPVEALAAYRQALAIYPMFEQARQGAARTARRVEGVET